MSLKMSEEQLEYQLKYLLSCVERLSEHVSRIDGRINDVHKELSELRETKAIANPEYDKDLERRVRECSNDIVHLKCALHDLK
jgi:predicted RNase H-like nuclease (RuvC/YqgF family)